MSCPLCGDSIPDGTALLRYPCCGAIAHSLCGLLEVRESDWCPCCDTLLVLPNISAGTQEQQEPTPSPTAVRVLRAKMRPANAAAKAYRSLVSKASRAFGATIAPLLAEIRTHRTAVLRELRESDEHRELLRTRIIANAAQRRFMETEGVSGRTLRKLTPGWRAVVTATRLTKTLTGVTY